MKNLMIFAALFSFSASAWAEPILAFECKGGTNSGKVVSVLGCISGENLAECKNSPEPGTAFVTVKRWSETRKGPMIETVQLAADWFHFSWEEELFRLELGADFGNLDLQFVGGEEQSGSLSLSLSALEHKFNVLICEFSEEI